MQTADNKGVPVPGLIWQAFASLAKGQLGSKPVMFLGEIDGGYGVFLENRMAGGMGSGTVGLQAEKSGRLRVFKRVETALGLCRKLGAMKVPVRFRYPDGNWAT